MSSIVQLLIKMKTDATSAVVEARKVTGQLDAIQRKATSVGNSLRQAFSFSGFQSALMSVPGMQFLTNPYTMIGAGIGAITKLGSEAEMAAINLESVVGNADQAKNVLADISKYAVDTPFSKLEITKYAESLMSARIPAEQVMTYIRQLGDVSGGSSEKLAGMALALGQVFSKGKLKTEEMLQFTERGFNPLAELSEATGKSMAELSKLAEKGDLGPKHLAIALAHATGEGGRFHNRINNLADSVGVKLQRLAGEIQEIAIDLFRVIEPYVSKVIGLVSRALPYVKTALTGFFNLVAGGITFVKEWWQEIALAGTIIGIVAGALFVKSVALSVYAGAVSFASLAVFKMTAVMRLLNITMIANPVGAVITGIAILTAVIVYCWHKFAGFRAFLIVAWDTIKQLGTIIKDYVINRLNELLEGIGNVGKALQQLLSGDFSGAWDTMGNAVKQLTGYNSATTALSQGKELVGVVKGQWQDVYAKEQAKDAKGEGKSSKSAISAITEPTLKGSAPMGEIVFGEGTGKKGKGKKGKKDKTAEAIATGGSRPTTINITIGKLIESQNISMLDKSNPEELERVVLQALNRSLAIATSTE